MYDARFIGYISLFSIVWYNTMAKVTFKRKDLLGLTNPEG